ncbi:MAG: UPF0175 family protein [Lachnospiraceae bacterium]|nr:UPF0175 family protein [Lachnospiraceae bacterium]
MKQINNLCTGVKLAVELKAKEDNLRKFLTVQGYCYNADGQVIRLEKVLNKPDFLDAIYFEVRCYELSVDYYTNHWDVTEDDFAAYMKCMLAVDLYKNKKVSLGYCASIADMTKEDFIKYLGKNEISIFSFEDEKEFLEELANA